MTARGPQAFEHYQEGHDSSEVPETRATRLPPTGNAPVSTAHEIRTTSNPIYHTAFMQCRSCCNCNFQCSYYGKGFFDAQGNYVG